MARAAVLPGWKEEVTFRGSTTESHPLSPGPHVQGLSTYLVVDSTQVGSILLPLPNLRPRVPLAGRCLPLAASLFHGEGHSCHGPL